MYYFQNGSYWRHKSSTEILALYAIVCSFGCLANLFVYVLCGWRAFSNILSEFRIIAFLRTPNLRNLRNYFIVNLAFSDLMLCCLTAPATLYLTLNLFWPFGNLACQMVGTLG